MGDRVAENGAGGKVTIAGKIKQNAPQVWKAVGGVVLCFKNRISIKRTRCDGKRQILMNRSLVLYTSPQHFYDWLSAHCMELLILGNRNGDAKTILQAPITKQNINANCFRIFLNVKRVISVKALFDKQPNATEHKGVIGLQVYGMADDRCQVIYIGGIGDTTNAKEIGVYERIVINQIYNCYSESRSVVEGDESLSALLYEHSRKLTTSLLNEPSSERMVDWFEYRYSLEKDGVRPPSFDYMGEKCNYSSVHLRRKYKAWKEGAD